MEAALVALIRIQPSSISQLAVQMGFQKSNLLAAMAGNRSLPERIQGDLLALIGLDKNGAFTPQRIYRWRVRDVHHLAPLLGAGLLGNITLYAMKPPRRQQALAAEYWLLESTTSTLAILRARPEVLVSQEIPGITLSGEVVDTPEPAQWWTDGVPRAVVMTMLEQLKTRRTQPAVSWSQVIAEAERRGVSPDTVLDAVLRMGQ